MGFKLVLAMAFASVAGMAQPAPPAPAPRAHPSVRAMVPAGTYLGVGVADVDPERARALKLTEARGAEVTTVNEDTPAAKAGIRVGDVILDYNGQPVQGTQELQRLVRETPPGRQVKIGLWRNGAPITVTAVVEQNKGTYTYNWPFGEMNFPPIPPMLSIDIPRMVTTFQNSALGVESESLTSGSQLAEFFGVKDGLLVRSVRRNSAAEKAGIKAGDVVVKFANTHIGNNRDLMAALRATPGTSSSPVTVVRNKREMALTLTLEDSGRPEHF